MIQPQKILKSFHKVIDQLHYKNLILLAEAQNGKEITENLKPLIGR